ncbi:hypothetical protein [Candidatus Binatus sp.]|uniref:hypothetical protein n=1 Tax=Candidatus Binatus sp. TaxID=2811406 RepID=UPI002F93F843
MSASLGDDAPAAGSINVETAAPSRLNRISLFHYSPALIFIVIVVADTTRLADPDLWGHVRFGQDVLAQRHLIFYDRYSYSAPGHLWLNHEWLSEVVMAAIYNAFGTVGLKLMKFACSAATIVFLALALEDTESPARVQFAILIAASAPLATHLQFRPQIFTFALMSCLLAILSRYNYRGRAPVWLAIPMLAVWANLHGGFIMGLAALGTFTAVVFVQDLLARRGMRRAAWLCAITAASTIATLATPYGVGTWQAVIHALANPHTRTTILDWLSLPQSLLFHWRQSQVAGVAVKILAIAMFVALGVTFIQTPRGGDIALIAIAALMIAAAFLAVRNLPLAVIATVTPLARHTALALAARRERLGLPVAHAKERSPTINQLMVAVAAFELLILTGLFSKKMAASDPYPVGAISYMKQHHLTGNILADFQWGEYVIWHTAPASKVFIDGRYDTVYPPKVIDDYLPFTKGEVAGKEILASYPHDFVLVGPKNDPPYQLIIAQPGWKQIYRDDSCVLFARDTSAAARLAPITVSAKDTPENSFP